MYVLCGVAGAGTQVQPEPVPQDAEEDQLKFCNGTEVYFHTVDVSKEYF